jgi:hypothetical protein
MPAIRNFAGMGLGAPSLLHPAALHKKRSISWTPRRA